MSRFDDLPRARWQRIDAVFRDALELDAAERAAFVERTAVDDPELARLVAELLHEADSGEASLGGASLGMDADLLRGVAADLDPDPLQPGARVGSYKLLGVIGRGGSGTVYLAERDDGVYWQRVALKVLRRGLDTEDVLARFRAERQILAALDHPSIARLLDGGATPDGRPFIVLEAVAGEPITAYADRKRLDTRQRLRLFLIAADATQYAHSRLVVHRDLKPSNILVDDAGRVKLVDFGIAKLLDAGAVPGDLPVTRTEARLLTPDYATPEQVRGETVTTATDVYQLGILLYELLAGRHPHPAGEARGSTLERLVCETDPLPPSAAVDVAASDAAAHGRARAMRGDVDRIVMKALEKEPEQRYPSVEQLAEDVRRFLDGLPIRARPASAIYRAGKIVRRHPGMAAAAAAAAVASVAFVATLWSYAGRLEVERDRAHLEAERAELTSNFLVDLFALPELEEGRGDTLTARVALDRGAERLLAGDDALEPSLRASMLFVLGRAYVGLGVADAARPVLENSVAMRTDGGDGDALEHAEALLLLAAVHRERQEYDEAGDRFAAAVALLDALPEPHAERLADALQGLALSLRRHPEFRDSATALARRAVVTRARAQGGDHPAYANALATLSYMTGKAEDRERAIAAYRAAIERLRADPTARRVHAYTASNLGYMLRRSGQDAEAEPYFREALRVSRALEGDAHPHTILALSHLAQLLTTLGRHDEARALIEQRLATETQERGPDHWRTAAAAESFAQFYLQLGDVERALTYFRDAHRILSDAVGHDDSRTTSVAESIRSLCDDTMAAACSR